MELEVIVERCAFLDVHRDTVMACARTPDGHGGRREDVSEFGTTTSQLLALADWLSERRVSLVGMEATGVYWKPVHWVGCPEESGQRVLIGFVERIEDYGNDKGQVQCRV